MKNFVVITYYSFEWPVIKTFNDEEKAKIYFEKIVREEIESLLNDKKEIKISTQEECFRIDFDEDFIEIFFVESKND